MARQIKVEILGESRQLVRELRKARAETESFKSKLSGMGKAAAIAGGAAGLAIVTEGLKSSLEAAIQAQAALLSKPRLGGWGSFYD